MGLTTERAPGIYKSRSTAPKTALPGPGAFYAGITLKGRADEAVLVNSYTEFLVEFGGVIGTSALADNVDAHFRMGGGPLWIARNLGASAAIARLALTGSSGTTVTLWAKSAGTHGNSLSADVVVDGTSFTIYIYDAAESDTVPVEQTTSLATRDDIEAAFADSDYIGDVIIGADSGDPIGVVGSAFTLGTNGTTSDVTKAAAVALFTDDLGDGPVAIPGDTTESAAEILFAHAAANTQRTPLVDLPDAAAATSVATLEDDYQGLPGADISAGVAFIGVAGGGPAGADREIAGSTIVAARLNASDRTRVPGKGFDAGFGQIPYIKSLKRTYTTDERRDLNVAGGTVAILDRQPNGTLVPTIYSDRTISDRTDSDVVHELSDARVLASIEHDIEQALKKYAFADMTPETEAQITGDATAVGGRYFDARVICSRVDGTDTGRYEDAFSVEVVPDYDNSSYTVNAHPRPSKSAETFDINVVRQLVEG